MVPYVRVTSSALTLSIRPLRERSERAIRVGRCDSYFQILIVINMLVLRTRVGSRSWSNVLLAHTGSFAC